MLTVQPFIGIDSVDWAVTTVALIAPFVPCMHPCRTTDVYQYSSLHGVGDAPPPAGVLVAPTDGVLDLCMRAWCDVVTNPGSRGVVVFAIPRSGGIAWPGIEQT